MQRLEVALKSWEDKHRFGVERPAVSELLTDDEALLIGDFAETVHAIAAGWVVVDKTTMYLPVQHSHDLCRFEDTGSFVCSVHQTSVADHAASATPEFLTGSGMGLRDWGIPETITVR